MTYFRCFAGSQVVAYAPQAIPRDHLFVYQCQNPAGEPAEVESLDDLVNRWSGSRRRTTHRRSRAVTPRSIFFCQKFDLETIENILSNFAFKTHWGSLAYWRSTSFTGGTADTRFPSNQLAQIDIGNLRLRLKGPVPKSLDDFSISVEPNSDTLKLGFNGDTQCTLLMKSNGKFRPIAEANNKEILLPLKSRKGFVAGAVAMATDWPKNRDVDHPLQLVGFVFQTGEQQGPLPVKCQVWRAQFADEVEGVKGDTCTLALDPRDGYDKRYWFTEGANSWFNFGKTQLRSSFFGTQGQRFHLRADDGGIARLGFIFDYLKSDDTVDSSGDVIFHPEGPFQVFRHPKRRRTRRATGSHDLILGAAATEFVDLEGVSHIHFEKGSPAFMKPYSGTPDETILEKKEGDYVITSFLRFAKGKDRLAAVDYHSQPADAPLFEDKNDPKHLPRRRKKFGVTNSIPVFPFAGFKDEKRQNNKIDEPQSIHTFDATHLSTWRRLTARRSSRRRDAVPSVGVTPQGLLAKVSSTNRYEKLLFGNSDSLDNKKPEFSISIEDGQTDLYEEFQRALSGSQLFLVVDRPDPVALKTIKVETTVYIRDFEFSVRLSARGSDAAEETSVLIVKYFKDRTLKQLLEDPTTWVCKTSLASKGNERILRLLHEGGDESKPIPEDLKNKVLNDPDWQGVLMLRLPIPKMPDVLEALRPGIVKESLNVHHFGLDFLPVKQADLKPDPQRFCSAFGLINYTLTEEPKPPETIDKEPVELKGKPDDPKRKYKFVVRKLDIGFSNSQVSHFDAEIDVTFSHLFWDKSTSGRGKNQDDAKISLKGAYERRVTPDNQTEDVFSLKTEKEYKVDFPKTPYLQSLTIKRAQLSVISAERDKDKLKHLRAFIGIDADLIMKNEALPIPFFKISAIHLTNFGFELDYYPSEKFGFGLKADGIGADIEFDPPSGLSSILEALPVKLKGMSVAIANLLDLSDLGFGPINFKDGGGSGAEIGNLFHFGFVFEVDFGSLGSLAGDLRGLRMPMIIGWRGGKSPGVAFGIQFPTFDGKIDIGLQQFVRFRADNLVVARCPTKGERKALGIGANNAKIVLLGMEFPQDPASFFIFLMSDEPGRKVRWALGVERKGTTIEYVGIGQRLGIQGKENTVKAVVEAFKEDLKVEKDQFCDIIDIIDLAKPSVDGWTVATEFKVAGFKVWLAVSDAQKVYGLRVDTKVVGEIDVLYRRVSDQLGIFSAEYTLPDGLRTIQAGAASIRLPAFRLEIHTDGGFLIDVGFPWKNDFSRSCQVEVAIFLGAGGFYFGRTSALATELLQFPGGYGYLKPLDTELGRFKVLRIGFAARAGIGRSFSIGILSAEASLTIFGGIEGAAGYLIGTKTDLNPDLYALRGYVGLMLHIEAKVDFVIIKARAKLLAYAMVGLELRRVLAKGKGPDNKHYLVKLPFVVFAEVGISIEVEVEISIGCVSITIHLAFSATLRIEERLGELDAQPLARIGKRTRALPEPDLAAGGFEWDPNYHHWPDERDINLFVTVAPCLAMADDVGEVGDYKTCAVGQMLLQMDSLPGGLSDLAQFLTSWVYASYYSKDVKSDPITLKEVADLREKAREEPFWNGFGDALKDVVTKQFKPILKSVSKRNSKDAFATMPFWPGTSFRHVPKKRDLAHVVAVPGFVTDAGNAERGDEVSFKEYARCLITGALAQFQQLIVDFGESVDGDDGHSVDGDDGHNDPARSLSWADLWKKMLDS